MNITFTDVSSFFSNLAQQDFPRKIQFNSDHTGPEKLLFTEKLSRVLEKTGNSMEQTLSIPGPALVRRNSEGLIDDLLEKLGQEKGVNLLPALKNFFSILSNGDLKSISIDRDGLDAAKELLVKAGFKEADIEDLISVLSEKFENKANIAVSAEDFLSGLFDLSPVEPNPELNMEEENYLETSVIPFLESIFVSLGIPAEKIQTILSKSDQGDKGISLDIVIKELHILQKQSFYSQNHYTTGKEDRNIGRLLHRLGLGSEETTSLKFTPESRAVSLLSEESKPSQSLLDETKSLQLPVDKSGSFQYTLRELIGSLEKLQQQIKQQRFSTEDRTVRGDQKPVVSETTETLLTTLFKSLKGERKGVDSQLSEFSREQIRLHLKDRFLEPDTGKINSFANGKIGENLPIDSKELASFLEGKKNTSGTPVPFEIKNQMQEGKELFQPPKFSKAKLSDQITPPISLGKTGEVLSYMNGLKTKASLKNLPAYVNHQVGKSVVRAISQGESVVRIQLKPPELGRLILTIENTHNSIKVGITTENHAAKEILASNMNDLKTVLSNSGVTLEKFEVDMSSDFRQSMADARNQSHNFGRKRSNRGNVSSSPADSETNDKKTAGSLAVINQDGSLHFVA